ncbi:mCG1051020, partial [Mus musculus]
MRSLLGSLYSSRLPPTQQKHADVVP